MRRLFVLLLVVTAAIFVSGCNQPASDSVADGATVPLASPNLNDVMIVEGEMGTGAMYALFCPSDWNGDLVVYAHGYVFPFQGVQLPDIDGLRDAWLGMGYGVAYSSYSEVGYAVKEGATNTRQLRGLFASNFGMPEKSFLVGHSMGGNISILLAERNPGMYAGALPLCGVIGGSQMAVDYVFQVRTLFDYFYPGVLPGNAQFVPDGLDPFTAVNLAVGAILGNPGPAFEMAGVDPVNIQYADPNELVDAIATGIFFQTGGWADFFDRAHSHDFFDNTDVVYSGSSDDAALNAGVDRFQATPDAAAYLERWYEPRGRLKIPVVSLHTSRDQVVQVFHSYKYRDVVTAAGNADMLSQHIIDRYGHCTFSLDEELAAFNELVAWAESLEPNGHAMRR